MNNMSKEVSLGIFLHKCLRCKHAWTSKNENPITCAKCRSPYWSEPKKKKD